jgi:GntR family transcriptional regulator
MPLSISIVLGSPTPVYRQIVDQVAAAAASGRLVEGEALPTVRALAEELVVNPNTVARAYSDLTREGILESRGNRGMFVLPRQQMYTDPVRRRRIEPTLDTFVSEALLLSFEPDEIHRLIDEKLEEFSAGKNR